MQTHNIIKKPNLFSLKNPKSQEYRQTTIKQCPLL